SAREQPTNPKRQRGSSLLTRSVSEGVASYSGALAAGLRPVGFDVPWPIRSIAAPLRCACCGNSRKSFFKGGIPMRTNSRPLVGINTDLRIPAKGRSPVSVVATGYVDCILGAGGIPIIVPPLTKEPDLRPIVDQLDALMLIGGDDLDPKRLGMAPHPAVR